MAQQIQVNLAFTADIMKAKAQVQELQAALNNLSKNTRVTTSDGIMTQFNKETIAASKNLASLQVALKDALNQNTGKLDLSKFNTSLKNSGLSLQQIKDSLSALGSEGERSFIKLAQSIMQADAHIKTSNRLLNSFVASLKNVAKYQISTAIYRGITSTFSEAFNYAQDLNTSLNQIQIVTGNSANEMARFAKEANIAAKELSTTTTAYTDASLIYYQQGLDDASVKERTDITIKAANAAGTNAEEMADYLTAVWNSYKVGSDELERYVDIMAALGAGTATSLEEISTAMEKVAAVGEATGVKFEQMSSIIATVSSVTRQSAETVGTAFKTIFARMADLSLKGSIEEDGVTTELGDVSSKLAAVDVNILDANGQLRDMGDVTEELMNKWNGMSEATQQAVAIAVAGKRQYTQLLALMNNQDMYREAMGMASGAEGTLQEQANIYAESWEASKKRVQAAAQGIYDSLINDDFFIDFNDGIATALTALENLIDHMGGFKGVLLSIGTIFGNVFSQQIANKLTQSINSLKTFGMTAQQQAEQVRASAQAMINDTLVNSTYFGTEKNMVEADSIKRQVDLQQRYIQNAKFMSEEQRKTVQFLLDQQDVLEQNVIKQAQLAEETRQTAEAQAKTVLSSYSGQQAEGFSNVYDRYSTIAKEASNAKMLQQQLIKFKDSGATTIEPLYKYLISLQQNIELTSSKLKFAFGKDATKIFDTLTDKLANMDKNTSFTKIKEDFDQLIQECEKTTNSLNEVEQEILGMGEANPIIQGLAQSFARADGVLEPTEAHYTRAREALVQYTNQIKENANAETENLNIQNQAIQQGKILGKTIDEMSFKNASMTQGFVVMGNVLMSVSSGINSLMSVFSTLNDPDMTGVQKFQSILMSLPMTIMTVTSLMKLFNAENLALNAGSLLAALGLGVKTKATTADIAATTAATIATKGFLAALKELIVTNPILLAITIALVALIGTIIAVTTAINKKRQAIIEDAKATQEAVENSKKAQEEISNLSNEAKDLSDSLEEQRKAGEDISNTYKNLSSKLNEIRDNYKDLGISDTTLQMLEQSEAVGLATDNWEQYNKVKAQADKEVLRNAADLNRSNINSSLDAAKTNFTKGQGYKADGGNIVRRGVGNFGIDLEVAKILNQEKYKNILRNFNGSDDGDLVLRFDNPANFIEDYKALANVIKELEQNGKTTNDTYKELKEEFNSMSEQAGNLENSLTELQQQEIKMAFDDIDISKVITLKQYLQLLKFGTNEVKQFFTSTEEAGDAVKTFLDSFSETSQIQQTFNLLEKMANKLSTAIVYEKGFVKRNLTPGELDSGEYPEGITTETQLAPVVKPKFDEKSAKDELNKFTEYLMSLSEREQLLALQVNLDYIDSTDKFKAVLLDLQDYAKKIKVDINPEANLESATELRENLSSIMEDFKEQGYLTTTQTVDFLSEFPEYEKYLIKVSNGYALSTEAVEDFNIALEDQKKALDEIVNPTNIAGKSMYDFGQELISIKQIISDENFQNIIDELKDVTIEFINGKISSEEYFNNFNEKVNSIDVEKLSSNINDAISYSEEVYPSLIKGITDYGNAMTKAFEEGRIGADEYRESLNTVLDSTIRTTNKSITSFKAMGQDTSKLEEDVKDLYDSFNDLNDFELFGEVFENNFSLMEEFFNEDFSLKIDDSELDQMVEKTKVIRDELSANFLKLEESAQTNVIDKILEVGKNFESAATDAYVFQSSGQVAFQKVSESAKQNLNTISAAAIDSLYNTSDSANVSAQLTGETMSLIASATARTVEESSTRVNTVIGDVRRIIQNFSAEISITFNFDASKIKQALIDGIQNGGNFSFTDIGKLSFSGKATGDTATALLGGTYSDGKSTEGILSKLTNLNTPSRLGGLSTFSPKGRKGAGAPSDIELDSPPESGKSSKGSGGKGGKGDSYKSPQKTEIQSTEREAEPDLTREEDEVERYEDSNTLLEKQDRLLEELERKKEDVYGKKYIEYLDQENEGLTKKNELLKQQNEEIKKYREQDISKLESLGLYAELDEQGNILNKEDLKKQIVALKNESQIAYTNAVNAAHEAFDDATNAENAGWDNLVNSYGDTEGSPEKDVQKEAHEAKIDAIKSEHEASTKAAEAQRDSREQELEDALTAIDNIQKGSDKLYENLTEMEENLAKQRENNYEKLNHKLEIQLELTETERKQMEVMSKRFREGLFGLSDFNDKDNAVIGTYLNDLKHLEEQTSETNELFAQGGISERQYYEKMRELNDQVADTTENIYDLSDAIEGRFIEALNEADEIVDKTIGKFNHLKTIMNSVENLIKLTYGEEDFDALGDVYDNIAYASKYELEYNRKMFEERKKNMDAAREDYNNAIAAGMPEGKELDQLKENLDEAENSVREWQEKMYSSAEEFAEAIINVYQNKINKAMKQLEMDLTSGEGFDELQQQIDRLKTYDEEYLTDVNQQYETQKLIRTATNALEKASNQVAKNKLDLFIKETEELQKQGKLSQYELGIQQRKYEIALAEIALQEAQSNKSQVRLQRDSEGNFNYVYTADEDKVNEAQQQYEDAQNDLYNYIREQEAAIQQKRLENWMNYYEAAREINEDATLDAAEKEDKLTELYEYHSQRNLELTEQSNIGREASNQAYLDSYTITVQDDIATTREMHNAHTEMADAVDEATKELKDNMHIYTDLMDQDMIDAKKNADNYAINVEKDMERTGDALGIVQEQTSRWANAMSTLLDNVANRYNNIANACQNAMETISGFFSDTDYSLMWQNAQDWDTAMYALQTREYMVENNIAGKGKYTSNAAGGLDLHDYWDQAGNIEDTNSVKEAAKAAMLREAKIRYSGNRYEDIESTISVLRRKFGEDTAEYNQVLQLLHDMKVPGFDTGGYTGEFGPEGKFAILHEKELVLNQQDTQNLLDTIDIVDKLLNNLEYQRLLQDFNISNIRNGINRQNDTIEQDVTIHAEFPNVQNHNEIEMALSNLVNSASQYANRKRS